MARKGIFFPLKDAALRDDVHALGNLVGEVIKEQCGQTLFDAVEGDRQAAIGRRTGDPDAAVELVVIVALAIGLALASVALKGRLTRT